jgi:hypothetical protein
MKLKVLTTVILTLLALNLASVGFVTPVSAAPPLLRVVDTARITTVGWLPVELPPEILYLVPITGLEVYLDGLAHINLLILPTREPTAFRVVAHLFWHGDAGAHFYMDTDGDGSYETWMEIMASMATAQIIANGRIDLTEPLLAEDMLLNLIAVGKMTLTVDGTTFTVTLRPAHILIKISDGEVAWIKLWAP